MRPEEATWIGTQLRAFSPEAISPVLELGSSTGHFRTVLKPHIESEIHAPLRARGVSIVHSDAKQADGVDISGDATDPSVRAQLRSVGARCVLCCNMFEHVLDRAALAACCDDILAPGGVLVVTVPHSYPYHLDPIDTYFRPSAGEIASLFPAYDTIDLTDVRSGSYWSEICEGKNLPLELVRAAAKLAIPLGGLEMWKSRAHRFLWLTRPFVVAGAILRKPGATLAYEQ